MSVLVGSRLPAQVMAGLAIAERERAEGQCFILLTVDPDGQARPCLLSVGELLVVDDTVLRTVVWPDSRTTANLDGGAPALLIVAAPPDTFHIRAVPARLPDSPGSSLARFELRVVSVEVDGHDGMPVEQPMWFAAREDRRDQTLRMWRDQVFALRY